MSDRKTEEKGTTMSLLIKKDIKAEFNDYCNDVLHQSMSWAVQRLIENEIESKTLVRDLVAGLSRSLDCVPHENR